MSLYYYALEEHFPTLKKIREYRVRDHVYRIRKNFERRIEELIEEKDDFIIRFKEFYVQERQFHQDLSYTSILAYHSSTDRIKEWMNPPYKKPITIFDYPRYFIYRAFHFLYPRTQEVFPYVPRRAIFWERMVHKTKTGLLYFYHTPCFMAIIGGLSTGLMFSLFMGLMRTFQRVLRPTFHKVTTAVKPLPMKSFSLDLYKVPRYIHAFRGLLVNLEYFLVIFGVGGLVFGCWGPGLQAQYDEYDKVWEDIRYLALGELANPNEVFRHRTKSPKYTPDAIGLMHSTLAHRTNTLLEKYHQRQVAEKKYLQIEEYERKEKERERERRRLERKIAINHFSLMSLQKEEEEDIDRDD